MTSPNISALVARLEQPFLSTEPLDALCREAAQALRALEAESNEIHAKHKEWIGHLQDEKQALQRKLDQYGEWLRKCLDVLDDIGPADWLAEMRKGMGE